MHPHKFYHPQQLIKSFQLEKTHKIIQSKHHLTLPSPLLHHVPKCHIHKSLKYLQGWGLHHFPRKPAPIVKVKQKVQYTSCILSLSHTHTSCPFQSYINCSSTLCLFLRGTFTHPFLSFYTDKFLMRMKTILKSHHTLSLGVCSSYLKKKRDLIEDLEIVR